MSDVRINFDRLHIDAHGVNRYVVEAAVQLLDDELHKRLASRTAMTIDDMNLGSLSLGVISSEREIDASALSGMIADRLLNIIEK